MKNDEVTILCMVIWRIEIIVVNYKMPVSWTSHGF